jgi:hypothetical protein
MKSDPYITAFEATKIRNFYPTFLILKKINVAYEITLLSVCLCPPPTPESRNSGARRVHRP